MAAILGKPVASVLPSGTKQFASGANVIVVVYMLCVALSSRFTIDFFGLALFPCRLFLLIMFVPAAIALGRSPTVRLQSFDWIVLLFAAWTVLSLIVNNGFERGLKFGGSLAYETLGGYLIARAYVRDIEQMRKILTVYLLLIAALGLMAIPESVFGIKVFRYLDIFTAEAQPHMMAVDGEMRLGLHRAAVSFDHPILYGVFCGACLGFAWYMYMDTWKRWLPIAIIVFATFFSLSSVALLACILAIALIAWEWITRPVQYRTAITLSFCAIIYVVAQALTNRNVYEIILPLIILDPWSAHYRLLIWDYVTANLVENPIFGLGLNDWVRPKWMTPSVDCYWLVVALMGGFPALAMLAAAIILLLRRVHQQHASAESRERRMARLGWTVMMLVLAFQAFTVHYWGAMNSFFFFVLGFGAWMTDSGKGLSAVESRPEQATALPRTLVRRNQQQPTLTTA